MPVSVKCNKMAEISVLPATNGVNHLIKETEHQMRRLKVIDVQKQKKNESASTPCDNKDTEVEMKGLKVVDVQMPKKESMPSDNKETEHQMRGLKVVDIQIPKKEESVSMPSDNKKTESEISMSEEGAKVPVKDQSPSTSPDKTNSFEKGKPKAVNLSEKKEQNTVVDVLEKGEQKAVVDILEKEKKEPASKPTASDEMSGCSGSQGGNEWQVQKGCHLRRKQLSGAKRLKLRIQEAIANGERVIPRCERSQKYRKWYPHNPNYYGTSVACKSVESTGGGRVREGWGGTRHWAVERGPAWPKPRNSRYGGTSVGCKTVESGGSGRVNAGWATAEHGPVCSYTETLSSHKMAVISADYPEVAISEEQAELLQDTLVERILTSSRDGQPVQFLHVHHNDGAVILTCANASTIVWLKEIIPDLKPWVGADLVAASASVVLLRVKILLWVPKLLLKREGPKVLQLIQLQNEGISTRMWKIHFTKEVEEGATMVLTIDQKSFKLLQEKNFRVFLGMGRVNVKPVTKPAGSS